MAKIQLLRFTHRLLLELIRAARVANGAWIIEGLFCQAGVSGVFDAKALRGAVGM